MGGHWENFLLIDIRITIFFNWYSHNNFKYCVMILNHRENFQSTFSWLFYLTTGQRSMDFYFILFLLPRKELDTSILNSKLASKLGFNTGKFWVVMSTWSWWCCNLQVLVVGSQRMIMLLLCCGTLIQIWDNVSRIILSPR